MAEDCLGIEGIDNANTRKLVKGRKSPRSNSENSSNGKEETNTESTFQTQLRKENHPAAQVGTKLGLSNHFHDFSRPES